MKSEIRRACACDKCKEMCRRPCWPTPHGAKKLLDAGYANRLMLDWWVGEGRHEGNDIEILCPAIKGYEGKLAPSYPRGQCAFQDENGLCELHDLKLKPLEGILTRHDDELDNVALHKKIAFKWNTDIGEDLIARWKGTR